MNFPSPATTLGSVSFSTISDSSNTEEWTGDSSEKSEMLNVASFGSDLVGETMSEILASLSSRKEALGFTGVEEWTILLQATLIKQQQKQK